MRLREGEQVLVGGRPWGHGAIRVDTPPKGWLCPVCRIKRGKDVGRHTYDDGDECCTPCAQAWIDGHEHCQQYQLTLTL